jgi:hypothetical protein
MIFAIEPPEKNLNGILEQWNVGMVAGATIIIPAFHYSNIPLFRVLPSYAISPIKNKLLTSFTQLSYTLW